MSRMGVEISRLRKEIGISAKQLAKQIGVSEVFIIDVEAGRKILNDDLIKRVNKALRQEVGKLDLLENDIEVHKPEPDARVVKVIEKPVQDVWNEALSGVLMSVPVYDYKMDNAIENKKMPIVSNKIEGMPKDKVFYLEISDNDMIGFRIYKGDRALSLITSEFEKDSIYLLEYNGKRVLRQIKKLDEEKFLLISNSGSLKTITTTKREVKLFARLIRLEITL